VGGPSDMVTHIPHGRKAVSGAGTVSGLLHMPVPVLKRQPAAGWCWVMSAVIWFASLHHFSMKFVVTQSLCRP
jgi:hypothetical protein